MKWRDILADANKRTLSHNKLWANVAYLVATICFVRFEWLAPEPHIDLWLVYLGTLASATTASKLLSLHYNKPETSTNTENSS